LKRTDCNVFNYYNDTVSGKAKVLEQHIKKRFLVLMLEWVKGIHDVGRSRSTWRKPTCVSKWHPFFRT